MPVKHYFDVDGIFFMRYHTDMDRKRVGVSFTVEDEEIIEAIKRKMAETQGQVSTIAALRYAIRLTAKQMES